MWRGWPDGLGAGVAVRVGVGIGDAVAVELGIGADVGIVLGVGAEVGFVVGFVVGFGLVVDLAGAGAAGFETCVGCDDGAGFAAGFFAVPEGCDALVAGEGWLCCRPPESCPTPARLGPEAVPEVVGAVNGIVAASPLA